MKILYTCLSRSWGETEQYTVQVIKKLLEKNIEIELVCFPESRLHIECNNLSLMIHPFPVKGYLSFYQSLKLASLISRRKYNIIHSQTSKDLWLVSPALRLLKRKVKLVLTKHIFSGIEKKDKAHNWIYKKVTRAVAVSKTVKDNLLTTCQINDNKILIIPNFADTSVFYPDENKKKIIKKEFNSNENDFIVSFVCKGKRIDEYKNIIEFLSNKFNDLKNIRFLFLGESFRGEEHYSGAIHEYCINNNYDKIIFPGIKYKLEELLQFSDILIYNAAEESFSTRIIEAMACGNVVICNNQSGANGLIENNSNGFIFENINSENVIEKIKELNINKEYFLNFQMKAVETVQDKFSLDVHTDKLLNLYNELID